MQKTDVLVTVIEMARASHGFTPTGALDCISDLIGRQDPEDVFYDRNVEELLRLGACIWSLRQGIFAPASTRIVPPARTR